MSNYRTVKVKIEILAPSGATHYSGQVHEEPTWYKFKDIGDYIHWFFFNGEEWIFACHSLSNHIKSLEQVELNQEEEEGENL